MRLLRTIGGVDFTRQERATHNKLTMPGVVHRGQDSIERVLFAHDSAFTSGVSVTIRTACLPGSPPRRTGTHEHVIERAPPLNMERYAIDRSASPSI